MAADLKVSPKVFTCVMCRDENPEPPILTHGMPHGYDSRCLISWLAHEKLEGRVSKGGLVRCPFYSACKTYLSEKNIMEIVPNEIKDELKDKLTSTLSERHLIFKILNCICLAGIISSVFMLIFSTPEGQTKTFSDMNVPLQILIFSTMMCLTLNAEAPQRGRAFSPQYLPADDIDPIQPIQM
ncbi:MAG TPA: hypothetical protein DCE71_05250 [Parachlamydiales bacterium]|nr:hypothetical protein [Parachlamydiales bacterium]